MASNNFKQQVDAIVKNLTDEAHKMSEPELLAAVLPMLQRMYEELKGYSPLTGNTNNSLAVGLYRDGSLIGYANVRQLAGVNRPTRETLKAGDIYALPFTWLGNALSAPIGGWKSPKKDWVGDRSFWADEEAVRFLQTEGPRRKGYCYKFVSAIDYAKYLEAKGKANVLTMWHDELAAAGATVSGLNHTL